MFQLLGELFFHTMDICVDAPDKLIKVLNVLQIAIGQMMRDMTFTRQPDWPVTQPCISQWKFDQCPGVRELTLQTVPSMPDRRSRDNSLTASAMICYSPAGPG